MPRLPRQGGVPSVGTLGPAQGVLACDAKGRFRPSMRDLHLSAFYRNSAEKPKPMRIPMSREHEPLKHALGPIVPRRRRGACAGRCPSQSEPSHRGGRPRESHQHSRLFLARRAYLTVLCGARAWPVTSLFVAENIIAKAYRKGGDLWMTLVKRAQETPLKRPKPTSSGSATEPEEDEVTLFVSVMARQRGYRERERVCVCQERGIISRD